jgi:predicted MFS family arabinose efflux permease
VADTGTDHSPFDAEDEPDPSATIGDLEEADLEGDRAFAPGTARAALGNVGFRRIYIGWLASNVGTWMQNVVLGAYGYVLTGSSVFVSILLFAQLGPLLLFSLVGGSLADRFDRRTLLIIASIEQAFFAFALAVVTTSSSPSLVLIVAMTFGIGVGQALSGPIFSSTLPTLVDRRDLPGAVSLMSANMNLSRVLGAALGPFVYVKWGVSWVFIANGITYFFIIAGVATVAVPRVHIRPGSPQGVRRLLEGFVVAKHDPVVGRILITCATFSFFCLIFIGQMAPMAATNLGISPDSTAFGWLYAIFGFGALLGALSIGTVFAGRDLGRMIRPALICFAVTLAVLASLRASVPAYPVIFVLGMFYFFAITSLSTVLQERLDDHTRGRVMALWIMAFGGTVPLGNLFFGPIIEHTSITFVLFIGVAVALGLAFYADLRDRPTEVAAETT